MLFKSKEFERNHELLDQTKKENEEYSRQYKELKEEMQLKEKELETLRKREYDKQKEKTETKYSQKNNLSINYENKNNDHQNYIDDNSNYNNMGNVKGMCTKIIDIFENKKSSNIVDNFINDYKIILSEINQIYEKEKTNDISKNDAIYVLSENSNDPQIAFKIVDEFQCFLDVLIESCRYYDFIPSNYMLKGKNSKNNVFLTQSVRNFLDKNPNEKIFWLYEKDPHKEKDSEHNKNCFKIKETNLKMLDKNVNYANNSEIDQINVYEEKIKILDEELLNVEDELISKLCKILLYLVFLCIIFVYYMNKFQIQQRFFVNEAVKSQIYEKIFYQNNKLSLHNSFSNLGESTDLEKWLFHSYTNIFTFSKIIFFLLI